MQRMSYIYILYFYNQQSMQNQTYPSPLIRQQFQPIEVQLQNGKQSKEVDFKLFVLLILILFLGFLINKHEEQFETHPQIAIQTSGISETSKQVNGNTLKEQNNDDLKEMEENEESYRLKKQLYLSHNTLQQTQGKLTGTKEEIARKVSPSKKQTQPKTILQTSSVGNQPQNTEESKQNSTLITHAKSLNQTPKPTSNHHPTRKYVQFYFWFPFFIFALIIYSCYEKQSASKSIFIEVKKSNNLTNTCEQCAICITDMKQGDLLAVLPCSNKHLFHSGCIKEWLAVKKTCPICRCDVRTLFL